MVKKHLFNVIVVAIVAVFFGSCGANPTPTATTVPIATEIPTPQPPSPTPTPQQKNSKEMTMGLTIDSTKLIKMDKVEGSIFPPTGKIDSNGKFYAEVRTKNGTFVIEFYPQYAPKTVENFINLSLLRYYDGLTFHRVIPDFVAQGGDPSGDGTGGPGYQFEDELSPLARHDSPGILSMANSGYGTNGSQFFITYAAPAHLDGYDSDGNIKDCQNRAVPCHTVFGKVIRDFQVVELIEQGDIIENIDIYRSPDTEPFEIASSGVPMLEPYESTITEVTLPSGNLDLSKRYFAEFNTNKGSITFELFPEMAPLSVESFINIASLGNYNGLTFNHQPALLLAIVPTLPEYRFEYEYSTLSHDSAGTLSLFNDAKNSDLGNRFFITLSSFTAFDGLRDDGTKKDCTSETCFAAIGKIVLNYKNLFKIAEADELTSVEIFTSEK